MSGGLGCVGFGTSSSSGLGTLSQKKFGAHDADFGFRVLAHGILTFSALGFLFHALTLGGV